MPHDLAKTILENVGDGILSVDASLRVVFVNSMACSILQRDNPEGMHIDDVISLVEYDTSCSPKPIDPFREVLVNGIQKSYSTPMVVSSIKDKLVYIEDSASPIKNSDGEIIGAVMVFRDVSEEVQMMTLLKLASERYRMLFDSIRSGVAVYESQDGETFKIVEFNQAAQKIEGVGKEDVLGKTVGDAFPGVSTFGLLDSFKRVWKTGAPERMPCSFYEDKSRKGWRDNYVYKLPSGEIVAVYDDVTHKKASADKITTSIGKLRDSEERFRGMFENSSVGVVFEGTGPEYVIQQANRSFCEMVGYTRDEVFGKSVKDLIHPDDWDLSTSSSEKSVNLPPGGQPVKVTKRYIRKNGEVRWGTAFIAQLEREDGEIEHFVQIVDITDRKRAEDEKELLSKVVSDLNASSVRNKNVIGGIMLAIKDFERLDAVAVRLPERIGQAGTLLDYPFYFHSGFENSFIAEESPLCEVTEDGMPMRAPDGTPILSCVCGCVINGRSPTNHPFFTKNGSFWTNDSTDLSLKMGNTSLSKPRMTCWRYGYRSMAVIPIMSNDVIVGSMLLNAKRVGAFDERCVLFLEEVGKAMGVAFSRMQMQSDIEESKNALERANGILAVECDVAKGIATGVAGGFNSVMSMAVSKLKVRWMCVALVGEEGIAGKWTEENGSSVNSIDEEAKFTAIDAAAIRKWVSESQIYIGDHGNLPQCLTKIAKKAGGHWMAIPVTNDKSHASVGIMMMASKNGRKWSQDECDAMNGLATMFCILARGEKNRADLERKIGETILSIGNVFVEAKNGGGS